MKILLDECVDRRFGRELAEHFVRTVPQMGWAGIKNGDLLALAEKSSMFSSRWTETSPSSKPTELRHRCSGFASDFKPTRGLEAAGSEGACDPSLADQRESRDSKHMTRDHSPPASQVS